MTTVDHIDYHVKVSYKGKLGHIPVAMFAGQPNMLVGDIYRHATHKTDFNAKQQHDLPDGEYIVTERKWFHHQASYTRLGLFITITDIKAKK